VDAVTYRETLADPDRMGVLDAAERLSCMVDSYHARLESLRSRLRLLLPWRELEGNVEQLSSLESCSCSPMIISERHIEEAKQKSVDAGAIFEQIGKTDGAYACMLITPVDKTAELLKAMRTVDAESVSFAGMKGTVSGLIAETRRDIEDIETKLAEHTSAAGKLAKDVVKLGILSDYTRNLLSREMARRHSPATDQVVFFEGWVRDRDMGRLEKVVSQFRATSISRISPAPDEVIPVEIENNRVFRPFEVITRLYGMPQHFEVDPTALLSPFFAIYFALCLTDAGYGLILVAFSVWLLTRIQGDKKFMWLLLICSSLTVVAGALTGGWFGDGAQIIAQKLGWDWLGKSRERLMWFDPFKRPMLFFAISIGLGYVQIMTGILTAFVHKLRSKLFVSAFCDHLTWFVMVNCLILYFAAGKAPFLPAKVGYIAIRVAIIPAATIFLFSQREGGVVGRLGLGAYQLFSTVFFLGDLLSYLRLMALGMVTAGLAMSVNVVAQNASDIPYVGIILAIVILVVGHLFNTAINGLGAFVHSVRLQFVEFFPKFITGGGRQFSPLEAEYKHIYITAKSQVPTVVK
jgi:V/A-type H+-transporting ATPase subunit I